MQWRPAASLARRGSFSWAEGSRGRSSIEASELFFQMGVSPRNPDPIPAVFLVGNPFPNGKGVTMNPAPHHPQAAAIVRIVLLLAMLTGIAQAQCPGQWTKGPSFADVDGTVYALLPLPNNNLIIGGVFGAAGHAVANSIARWDGSAWRPLGQGTGGTIYSLA